MYCGNCGNEVSDNAVACMKCGADPRKSVGFCRNCGAEVGGNAVVCIKCGAATKKSASGSGEGKSRLMVGLLGIFLGTLGIHNFILGYTKKAVLQLLISVLGSFITFGLAAVGVWIWALVESIQILTKQVNEDADGVPLVD